MWMARRSFFVSSLLFLLFILSSHLISSNPIQIHIAFKVTRFTTNLKLQDS
jgi:hypothetical protein